MQALQDYSPQGLLDKLKERIMNSLRDSYWYPTEGSSDEYQVPAVFIQYIPVGKTANTDPNPAKDYPRIDLVLVDESYETLDSPLLVVNTSIRIDVHGYDDGDDRQGWRQPMQISQRIMQEILGNRIIGPYILTTPLSRKPEYSERPPYYHATIETTWQRNISITENPIEDISLISEV